MVHASTDYMQPVRSTNVLQLKAVLVACWGVVFIYQIEKKPYTIIKSYGEIRLTRIDENHKDHETKSTRPVTLSYFDDENLAVVC